MKGNRLTCDAIEAQFGPPGPHGSTVFASVSARFNAGQMALITGDTGAGKTTLLNILAGMLRPTAGQVFFGDAPVSRWTAAHRTIWRRQVGIVFQADRFLADRTVFENIMVPLIPQAITRGDILDRCRKVLVKTDLGGLADAPIERLSGGERQRVSLARALVGNPKVLLADEPTAHQDDGHADGVLAALSDAAHGGGAIVVVTAHDRRVADHPAVAARYHLDGGRLERVK